MEKYVIDKTTLTGIGDAIREKEGTTAGIDPIDMKARIQAIAGGGETKPNYEKAIVERTITEYSNDNITKIGICAFEECKALTSVDFPNVTSSGGHAFYGCEALTSVNIPNATSLGNYAFEECRALTSVDFPNVTSIGSYAFRYCEALTSVNIPNVTSIGSYAFRGCEVLSYIDFSGCAAVPTLANVNAFQSVPTTCKFRVPTALLNNWKAATNWSTYAAQIVGV